MEPKTQGAKRRAEIQTLGESLREAERIGLRDPADQRTYAADVRYLSALQKNEAHVQERAVQRRAGVDIQAIADRVRGLGEPGGWLHQEASRFERTAPRQLASALRYLSDVLHDSIRTHGGDYGIRHTTLAVDSALRKIEGLQKETYQKRGLEL